MADEKVREVKGPGPRGQRGMPKPKIKNPGKLLKRLMGYVFKFYGLQMILVGICIVVSVLANIQGTLFTKTLIDGYINPLLKTVGEGGTPDFGPLGFAILRVAVFYAIGITASYVQSLTMVFITQGTLKNLRAALFEHMESLPIKYFDTNAHGDIMSIYTNDIDTLRQMIS